jgi:CheY-like chemotaxis protein
VREELAALEKNAPGTVANVAETIRGTLELEQVLASRHRIELSMEGTQPDLAAAIHPSALRQVLVAVINTLIKHTSSGRIAIAAECTKARVFITVTGPAALTDKPSGSDLIQEILASHGGSIEIRTSDGLLSFRLELPRAEQITVLVVDDNLDLAHFYQRFLAGTRYRIVHVAQGQRVLETVETVAPDIIVLDVMLADIDGWEVLTYLHEHSATRSVPVIVCSVSREEELALALGATLYLPKPVRRAQFVQALDRALALVASPDRTSLKSSGQTP